MFATLSKEHVVGNVHKTVQTIDNTLPVDVMKF